MMLFALMIVSVLSAVEADIDRSDCTDVSGGYGVTVQCPTNYVAIGLCSSGRNSDCGGQYTRLRCCRETAQKKESRACQSYNGGYGQYISCPTGMGIFAVCTSGKDPDCSKSYSYMRCCNDHSQQIDYSSCEWRHGGYGVQVDCAHGYMPVAMCSSGKDPDCTRDGKFYTGLNCCRVL